MNRLNSIAFGAMTLLVSASMAMGPTPANAKQPPGKGEYYIAPLGGIIIDHVGGEKIEILGQTAGGGFTAFGAGVGVAFGIPVAPKIVLEPEFTVGGLSKNLGDFETLTGNVLFFFPGSGRMMPYFASGLGLAHAGGTDFFIQFGGGFDAFDLTPKVSMRLDGRVGISFDPTSTSFRFGAMFVIPLTK